MAKKKNKVDRYIDSLNDITDKKIIITGANSGLGYEIAKIALIKGAHVLMACRSEERANKAKDKLIEETGSNKVEFIKYDQADFDKIKQFAKTIKKEHSDFYSLVLNAGVFLPNPAVDDVHVSTTYKTNFLGALYLLDQLKDLLETSETEKRVIIQGSLASFKHRYKNKDKFIYGECRRLKQYSLSKLCCSNLYYHYASNNNNPHVKYLLCEPGVAVTNLFHNFKEWFKKIAFLFMKTFSNSPRVGSLSACKLMCDIAANGDYYRPGHLFTAKGLPKKGKYPRSFVYENIITDGYEVLKNYL